MFIIWQNYTNQLDALTKRIWIYTNHKLQNSTRIIPIYLGWLQHQIAHHMVNIPFPKWRIMLITQSRFPLSFASFITHYIEYSRCNSCWHILNKCTFNAHIRTGSMKYVGRNCVFTSTNQSRGDGARDSHHQKCATSYNNMICLYI